MFLTDWILQYTTTVVIHVDCHVLCTAMCFASVRLLSQLTSPRHSSAVYSMCSTWTTNRCRNTNSLIYLIVFNVTIVTNKIFWCLRKAVTGRLIYSSNHVINTLILLLFWVEQMVHLYKYDICKHVLLTCWDMKFIGRCLYEFYSIIKKGAHVEEETGASCNKNNTFQDCGRVS